MKKFFNLFRCYFLDPKTKCVRYYRAGKYMKLAFFILFAILVVPFVIMVIVSARRNDFSNVSNVYGLIKISLIYILIILFLYIIFLANHLIVTEEYVECVQLFLVRRKIRLDDIKGWKTIRENGALVLQIESKSSPSVAVKVGYMFFNQKGDLQWLISYIKQHIVHN